MGVSDRHITTQGSIISERIGKWNGDKLEEMSPTTVLYISYIK